MNDNYNEILQRVAGQTFESLAFMLVMPEPEQAPPPSPMVTVTVVFSGKFSGRLGLSVSEGMIEELAGNMLGIGFDSAGPTLEQQYDALKELSNVICGNFLPEIAGTEEVFNVDAPEVLVQDALQAEDDGFTPVAQAQLYLDSGEAALTLHSNQETFANATRNHQAAGRI